MLCDVEQIADLKAQAERSSTASGSAWEELRITRKRCDDLGAELAKLRAEVGRLCLLSDFFLSLLCVCVCVKERDPLCLGGGGGGGGLSWPS